MIQTLYNGISGVKSHQYDIDVWADNISNISTPGYKTYSAPTFSNLFTESMSTLNQGGTVSDRGFGVRFNPGVMNTTQGAIMETDSIFNVALNGNGWFGVEVPVGDLSTETMFTRNGTFQLDIDGNLVDLGGNKVVGQYNGIDFNNDPNFNIPRDIPLNTRDNFNIAMEADGTPINQEPLYFPPNLSYGAIPTNLVKIGGNIGTDAQVSPFKTNIYNADGEKNLLQIDFTLNANQPASGFLWDTKATIYSMDGEILSESSGETLFDSKGLMLNNTLTNIDNNGVDVTIDMGSGYTGITSNNLDEGNRFTEANGLIEGNILSYQVDDEGIINALFDNQEIVPVARLSVFHFANEQGLTRNGSNTYRSSANSGEPKFWTYNEGSGLLKDGKEYVNPATQRGARIVGNALEASNLDLAFGMTQLILAQHSYDASSRSITTADDMLKTAIGMVK